jgi:hypothetical protein
VPGKIGGVTRTEADVTVSQNARSRCTRRSVGLPAINAALIAPIDTPATQRGLCPVAANAS